MDKSPFSSADMSYWMILGNNIDGYFRDSCHEQQMDYVKEFNFCIENVTNLQPHWLVHFATAWQTNLLSSHGSGPRPFLLCFNHSKTG